MELQESPRPRGGVRRSYGGVDGSSPRSEGFSFSAAQTVVDVLGVGNKSLLQRPRDVHRVDVAAAARFGLRTLQLAVPPVAGASAAGVRSRVLRGSVEAGAPLWAQ